ncbi:MAG: hypothetical protein OEW58_02370 [Gammaproteobacteria bacterium]|nr:hypothetical protein [Gammaproteobacteria bacterium]
MKSLFSLCVAVVTSMYLLSDVMASEQAKQTSPAVQAMAKILMNVNHFPSTQEKQTLQKIVDGTSNTPAERSVAQAIINLQHSATNQDKTRLQQIISDKNAGTDVRTLARIVHDLNHAPSRQDKIELSSLQ